MVLALHLCKATTRHPHTALARDIVPALDPDGLVRIPGHRQTHREFQGRRERGMREGKRW
jgi:hypothetical protein